MILQQLIFFKLVGSLLQTIRKPEFQKIYILFYLKKCMMESRDSRDAYSSIIGTYENFTSTLCLEKVNKIILENKFWNEQ